MKVCDDCIQEVLDAFDDPGILYWVGCNQTDESGMMIYHVRIGDVIVLVPEQDLRNTIRSDPYYQEN